MFRHPEPSLQLHRHPRISSHLFHGAWGVYPFNSSGKIFISDIDSGLCLFERTQITWSQVFHT